MPDLPQRVSLVSQTAACIVARIEAGEWSEWLPGERALCEMLQVSRNTLRSALTQLKHDGLIEPVHGSGNRILRKTRRSRRFVQPRDVALLSPEPLERLRPVQTLWIDELRGLLSERQVRLRLFHGRQFFRSRPGHTLAKLVSRHPHRCWILMLSNESIQRWFARSGIPCVVAGSVHPGLDLPFRDLEYRAICRHAAGVLLGFGHRKIALLSPKAKRPGDLAGEEGFLEGVRQSSHREAEGVIVTHEQDVASAENALRRVLGQGVRPTGLVVANPYCFLTVASRLMQMGLRLPQDVSVISRDNDPFLEYFVPSPARYITSPHKMAVGMLGPVLELLDGGVVSSRETLLMPEFEAGESVGPAPG